MLQRANHLQLALASLCRILQLLQLRGSFRQGRVRRSLRVPQLRVLPLQRAPTGLQLRRRLPCLLRLGVQARDLCRQAVLGRGGIPLLLLCSTSWCVSCVSSAEPACLGHEAARQSPCASRALPAAKHHQIT